MDEGMTPTGLKAEAEPAKQLRSRTHGTRPANTIFLVIIYSAKPTTFLLVARRLGQMGEKMTTDATRTKGPLSTYTLQ
jgi:hypothetical protein